jgi:uncharacterized protein YbjT (DUF2867 family)
MRRKRKSNQGYNFVEQTMANVLLTGGSGYMGRALIPELVRRGHGVRALVRRGSEGKLAKGATAVIGDALDADSVRAALGGAEVLVHLVGVAHPSPAKAREFREIDLKSIEATVAARPKSLVYVSVAHPAPAMKSYIEARMKGEALIQAAGIDATILRPWYVLGPGHWWPVALLPMYWLMECVPGAREGARRLGLVTLRQMTMALADAVDRPAAGVRIVDVPGIRRAGAH